MTTRALPGTISFEDDTPPRPIIFTGEIHASLDHYRSMAEHNWSVAFPAAIFGSDKVVSEVQLPSAANLVQAAPTLDLTVKHSLVGPLQSTIPSSLAGSSSQSTSNLSRASPCMLP